MAFRFLLPSRCRPPDRPDERCSRHQPDEQTAVRPRGPIQSRASAGSGALALMAGSVSNTDLPQMKAESSSCALSSSSTDKRGLGGLAFDRLISPSRQTSARRPSSRRSWSRRSRRSAPFRDQTSNAPPRWTPGVPVSGPVAQMILLAGDIGSTWASTPPRSIFVAVPVDRGNRRRPLRVQRLRREVPALRVHAQNLSSPRK